MSFGGYDESTYRAILGHWKSPNQVGAAKPVMRAYVRTVWLRRHFVTAPDQDSVFAWTPGHPFRVWKGKWVPVTGWKRLPNVQEVRGDQDFESKGVQQATIDIDNVFMQSHTGILGTFHRILRGFFSPLRGYGKFGRPGGEDPDLEWFDVLRDKSTQIMVVGGYGDDVVPLFDGLVNDVDLSSRPDKISIIARDVGQLLTDQPCFLNAKYRGIRDPITFANWRSTYERDPVGHSAKASSTHKGHHARFVLDNNKDTEWNSDGHSNDLVPPALRFNKHTNPKGGAGVTTDYTNMGCATFEPVASLPTLDGLPDGVHTGFHCVGGDNLDAIAYSFPVVSGRVYTLSLYGRLVSLGGATRIELSGATGGTFVNPNATVRLTAIGGSFRRISIGLTANITGTATVRLRQVTSGAAEWHFTAEQLEETTVPNVPTQYGDGDSFRGVWDGTPQLSTSTLGVALESDYEWIQIHVPHGRYHSIKLHPRFDGMKMWIAMKPSNTNVKRSPDGRGSRKAWYGRSLVPGDWTNIEGNGNIPGTNIPFVKYVANTKAKETKISLPDFGYVVGDDTVIRLYFSKLKKNDGAYRAGVIYFKGMEADMDEQTRKEKWLLTDDATDAVKSVFQWIGLNDWEVETAGVGIKEPAVFNRGNFLMDIVNNMAEQLNYVFYVKPPAYFDESQEALDSLEEEESMGVGVFRQNQAMRKNGETIERAEMIHENETLQTINVKFTDEPLAFNIRVRGKEAKKKQGGAFLSGDRTRRYTYVYTPPWSRYEHPGGDWPDSDRDLARNANIKKYAVHHDPKLKSEQECKIAALFIAFAEALKSAQVQVECSALPIIHLDYQVGVFDTGTGISARMWVAMRSWVFTTGSQAKFRMTLGGSILDTPDLVTVRHELEHALRDEGYDPGTSTAQRGGGPHHH